MQIIHYSICVNSLNFMFLFCSPIYFLLHFFSLFVFVSLSLSLTVYHRVSTIIFRSFLVYTLMGNTLLIINSSVHLENGRTLWYNLLLIEIAESHTHSVNLNSNIICKMCSIFRNCFVYHIYWMSNTYLQSKRSTYIQITLTQAKKLRIYCGSQKYEHSKVWKHMHVLRVFTHAQVINNKKNCLYFSLFWHLTTTDFSSGNVNAHICAQNMIFLAYTHALHTWE